MEFSTSMINLYPVYPRVPATVFLVSAGDVVSPRTCATVMLLDEEAKALSRAWCLFEARLFSKNSTVRNSLKKIMGWHISSIIYPLV